MRNVVKNILTAVSTFVLLKKEISDYQLLGRMRVRQTFIKKILCIKNGGETMPKKKVTKKKSTTKKSMKKKKGR